MISGGLVVRLNATNMPMTNAAIAATKTTAGALSTTFQPTTAAATRIRNRMPVLTMTSSCVISRPSAPGVPYISCSVCADGAERMVANSRFSTGFLLSMSLLRWS